MPPCGDYSMYPTTWRHAELAFCPHPQHLNTPSPPNTAPTQFADFELQVPYPHAPHRFFFSGITLFFPHCDILEQTPVDPDVTQQSLRRPDLLSRQPPLVPPIMTPGSDFSPLLWNRLEERMNALTLSQTVNGHSFASFFLLSINFSVPPSFYYEHVEGRLPPKTMKPCAPILAQQIFHPPPVCWPTTPQLLQHTDVMHAPSSSQ